MRIHRIAARAATVALLVLAGLLLAAAKPADSSAGTVSVVGTKLIWTAPEGAACCFVQEANNVLFRVNSPTEFLVIESLTTATLTVGPGCTLPGPRVALCSRAGVTSLEASGGNLNDGIDAFSMPIPATINGGSGTDSMEGGTQADTLTDVHECNFTSCITPAGNDTMSGHEGNDTLYGGLGSDTLRGGTGNDSLDGSYSADTLYGDDGDDTLVDSTFGDYCWFSIGCSEAPGADTMHGGAGNDSLNGGAENDVLNGGDGIDTLDGGSGFCNSGCFGAGNDTLNGDAGNDILRGTDGGDALNGGDGDDSLDGGTGNDNQLGGVGVDTATYSARSASLLISLDDLANDGDPGPDGGADNVHSDVENVIGGTGADVLTGAEGVTNVLTGGGGDDRLDGGPYTCTQFCFFSPPEPDTLDGGTGTNTVSYATHNVGVTVNVADAGPDGGAGENDTLTGIQNIVGGLGNDMLTGDSGPNSLTGGPSSDALSGGNGIDMLVEQADASLTLTNTSLAGIGADTLSSLELGNLTGGAGNNTLDTSAFSGPVTLDGAGGDDALTAGPLNDTLTGGAGHDVLSGNDGNDTLAGLSGNDQLSGALGNDSLSGDLDNDVLTGGDGTDTLFGGQGDDRLSGGPQDDALDGNGGADRLEESGNVNFTLTTSSLTGLGSDTLAGLESALLVGGAGINALDASAATIPVTLDGGAGDDVLQGGGGADALTGGTGNDSLGGGLGIDTVVEEGDISFTLASTILLGLGTDTLATIERASLTGGPGNNTLSAAAFAGAVVLDGGAGDDALTGSSGDDALFGGPGLDRVSASGDTSFTLTDATLTGAGTDSLFTMELATLTGGASANTLNASGFTGSATLAGAGGDDILVGGSGADALDGGAGVDAFQAGGGADSIQSRDGEAESQVVCGAGTDSVVADAADVAAGDCEQVLVPFALTVGRTGSGSGAVTSAPAGIDCGVDCSEIYDSGASVTLTATPGANSSFTGWTGACTGSAGCVVSMDAAKTVTATFGLAMRTLTVAKTGNGAGTVTGTGINCGADCSESSAHGTLVTLSASPAANSSFTGWSGACTGTGGCSVTMDAAKTVTATFALPAGCTIAGTPGNDVLVGTPGKDVICGLGGNDTLKGLGGNDTLKGGAGNDKLTGGGGNDKLLGDAGNDTLTGSAGKDVLTGGAGADLLLAKDRTRDTANGGAGRDRGKLDRADKRISVERLL